MNSSTFRRLQPLLIPTPVNRVSHWISFLTASSKEYPKKSWAFPLRNDNFCLGARFGGTPLIERHPTHNTKPPSAAAKASVPASGSSTTLGSQICLATDPALRCIEWHKSRVGARSDFPGHSNGSLVIDFQKPQLTNGKWQLPNPRVTASQLGKVTTSGVPGSLKLPEEQQLTIDAS